MCYLYSMCTHTQVYCMWSHWHDVSLPRSPQFLCRYEWRIPLLKHHQTLTDPDSLTWWLKYTLWWGDSSADCSPVTADHIHSNTRAASSVPLVLLFPEKNISFTSDSIASDFKDFAFKQHTKLYYLCICAFAHCSYKFATGPKAYLFIHPLLQRPVVQKRPLQDSKTPRSFLPLVSDSVRAKVCHLV